MRSSFVMAIAAVALLAAVAGCASPEAKTTDQPTGTPPADVPAAPVEAEDAPEFCADEASCKFWDAQYHEYLLYTVDDPVVDVLIVPAVAPDPLGQTEVMAKAVRAWADGINIYGAQWFTDSFRINVYVLGTDIPTPEALSDPEIVVVGAEFNPAVLFGIGLEPSQFACSGLGQQSLHTYPVHHHDGMLIKAESCTGLGFVCFAINTNFALQEAAEGRIYMQDLVAHEFGHCLGGGHVGDALDYSAKTVPVHDIMSYQHDASQVHCVSTLNVRALEDIYAPLIDSAPDQPRLSSGDWFTMDPADYTQVTCENP